MILVQRYLFFMKNPCICLEKCQSSSKTRKHTQLLQVTYALSEVIATINPVVEVRLRDVTAEPLSLFRIAIKDRVIEHVWIEFHKHIAKVKNNVTHQNLSEESSLLVIDDPQSVLSASFSMNNA